MEPPALIELELTTQADDLISDREDWVELPGFHARILSREAIIGSIHLVENPPPSHHSPTRDFKDLPTKARVVGTPFQLAVWRALLEIPVGELRSYAWVAERAGRHKAVRATAQACASNPLAWLIPCHRVIRSDGSLGGFHWGIPIKKRLLDWEQTRLRVDLRAFIREFSKKQT